MQPFPHLLFYGEQETRLEIWRVLHVCAMAHTFAGSPEEAVDPERQALRLSPITQDSRGYST